MRDQELFYRLKEKVLVAYRDCYPFFQGDWKSFGSRDIQNLIDAMEKKTRQTISEKWIYTHLKPETNEKLPRKDMLDILSRFVGYTGWDEFAFQKQEDIKGTVKKRSSFWIWVVAGSVLVGIIIYGSIRNREFVDTNTEPSKSISKPIVETNESNTNNVEPVMEAPNKTYVPLKANEEMKGNLSIDEQNGITESFLEPEDYTMILKAFMLSEIKDWETRKQKLEKILSPDLEVIVMLGNNLGAEYFNKTEFAHKLILPTASVRRMKIIDLQTDANNQVRFIRIQQE
ncbi:MAG: hypothetical protein WBA61_11345 [Aequorivita sp.]